MIEPEIAPAGPQHSFRVYEITNIDDVQNNTYVHLVGGSPEELDALDAELDASPEFLCESHIGWIYSVEAFREEFPHYFPGAADVADDDD